MRHMFEAFVRGRTLLMARPRWAGQSTVEYALIGALVVIVAAAAMTGLGNELQSVFTNLTKQFQK